MTAACTWLNVCVRLVGLAWVTLPVLVAAAPLFSACGGSSASLDHGAGGGGTPGFGGSAGLGTGGAATAGSGGTRPDASGAGGSGGLGDAGACVGEVAPGEPMLDLYVMLDTSASMLEKTAQGSTRWDGIKQAFTSFLQDPGSAGLGFGIQYFPLEKAGVPGSCTSDAQCGTGAPCLLKSCVGAGYIAPCSADGDCGSYGECAPLGQCSADPTYYCQPVGGACGGTLGSCVQIAKSVCANSTSCLAGDYAKPAVPIATLPGSAPALQSSLNARIPSGNTPTGPALQGLITLAHSWAAGHLRRRVVAVLATDGLPTVCDPTDVTQLAKIAAQGANGSPGVDTFVIGMTGPKDAAAKAGLDEIAQDGGTGQALNVDTEKDILKQFAGALESIRAQALPCDLEIPEPLEGGAVDFSMVNIDYTDGSGKKQQLYNVADKSQCDPQQGGWYYDVSPKQGTPTEITLCDSVCSAFKQGGNVVTRTGCSTIEKPPM